MSNTIRRALVVEDEYIAATYVCSLVGRFGFQSTEWAKDGRAAVESVKVGGFDLIFMDIKLPGDLNGLEAAREIRKACDTPIVFLSGYQDEDMRNEALAIEATFYLEKPVLAESLARTLAELPDSMSESGIGKARPPSP